MNAKLFKLCVLFFLFISLNAFSQTVDEIIQKNIDATGGKTNWDALTSMKSTGYASIMGMDFAFTEYVKKPNLSLLEIIIQGMTMKQGYDGTNGWMINPMMGSKKPEKVDDETSKEFKDRANIGGKFLTYKDDGSKAELAGKEDMDGTEVYKIKLTEKDGKVINYYLDTKSYMILKESQTIKRNGKEFKTETMLSNYKTVNGVLKPYTLEVNTSGSEMGSQNVSIDKIEMNVEIDEAIFKMPTE